MTVETGRKSTWSFARSFLRLTLLVITLGSFSVASLSGCQLLGGVKVEPVAMSTQKPSNVAVYLSVQNGDEAVYGLAPDNFTIQENEQVLRANQVGLTLLDRNVAVVHHAVVLVDLSGSAQQEGSNSLLAGQLAPFVERLRDKFSVSLYGFDGSDDLTPLGGYGQLDPAKASKPVTKDDLATVTNYVQKDSSSNLNGAVVSALKKLDQELAMSPKPLAIGTLIILARGPDLAARTKEDALLDALDTTKHQVFAVTVGPANDTKLAETLGRAGYAQTSIFENLENSLADVATLVERDHSRYYLVSYCSPSRSGNRTLLVSINKTQGDGSELSASTELEFNATGFQSGCDATTVPTFAREAKGKSPVQQPEGIEWFGQGSGATPAGAAEAPAPDEAPATGEGTEEEPAAEPPADLPSN